MPVTELLVQKYGGTSNGDPEAVKQSASVVAQSRKAGQALMVIESAMSGVTDQLSDVIHYAVERAIQKNGYDDEELDPLSRIGLHVEPAEIPDEEDPLKKAVREGDYKEVYSFNAHRHHVLIDECVEPKIAGSMRLHEMVDKRTATAMVFTNSMVNLHRIDERALDWIRAKLGEGLTAPIDAAVLLSMGVDAVYYKAVNLMVTDGTYGKARPHIKAIKDRCSESDLRSDFNKNRVVVTEGFMGSPDRGKHIVTLGKGASDETAVSYAEAMADYFQHVSVSLLKRDPKIAAVMSADPKFVDGAHTINHMIFYEAGYLGTIGGNIFHPKTVEHALRSAAPKRRPFPIRVLNSDRPYLEGTLINDERRPDDPVIKAVSAISNAVSIRMQGMGMDKPGIMGKSTGALAEKGIDIAFISQPSAFELFLAFQYTGREKGVELDKKIDEVSRRTQDLLRDKLADDMESRDISSISARPATLFGIIGEGATGLLNLGRVFDSLGEPFAKLKSPHAYRMATGTYGASLLFDFRGDDIKKALTQSAHDSVFEKAAV